MAVTIYLLGFLCFAFVFQLKHLTIFSPLVIFVFFCILYSIFPYLAYVDLIPTSVWVLPLLNQKNLIDIHLINVGLSIFTFSLCYGYALGNIKRKWRIEASNINLDVKKSKTTKPERRVLFIFFLIALVCIVLGYLYPWGGWGGDLGRPDLINSLLGNLKILLAVIIAYFFSRYGFNSITLSLLFSLLIIAFIEGSRTTLVSLVIALLIVAAGSGHLSPKRIITLVISAVFGFLAMIWVALSRIGISTDGLSVLDALYPLYFEGMYGSYMCLQIYDLISVKGIMQPTWGSHMIFDPLIFLIPRVLLSLVGIDKDSITIYADWKAHADNILADSLGPYGGFFYIADAFLSLPYIGPIIISGLFGFMTGYFEKLGTSGFKGRYIFTLYLVGFFMVFIKHQISQSTHFLLVTAILGVIVYWATKPKKLRVKTMQTD